MTCFSIHKFLVFSLFLSVFVGLAANPLQAAQKHFNPDGTLMTKEEVLQSRKIDAPIVVELFTASDCSACVLADRVLYDTMKDKNVIALSCHMQDLSDSLEKGVAERRGDNAEGKNDGPIDPCVFRQWAYNSNGNNKDVEINIPEFVINGQSSSGIANLPIFHRELDSYHYYPRNKTLEVLIQWKDKDTITVNLPQRAKRPTVAENLASGSVWLVRYKDMSVEKMDTGINQGKVLRFSNIIQEIKHVGKWRGDMRTMDIDVPKPKGGKERGGYAILVQEVMGGNMLAAGKVEDYPLPNDIKRGAEPETQKPMTMEHKGEPDILVPAPVPSTPAPKNP